MCFEVFDLSYSFALVYLGGTEKYCGIQYFLLYNFDLY